MQEVEANTDADAKGERAPAEVVTLKEVKIGVTTTDSRVRWRGDRVTVEYIYTRCSGGPAKNIRQEKGKTLVLKYFVASRNKSQGGSFFL